MNKKYIFPFLTLLLALSLTACAGGPRVRVPKNPGLSLDANGRTVFPGLPQRKIIEKPAEITPAVPEKTYRDWLAHKRKMALAPEQVQEQTVTATETAKVPRTEMPRAEKPKVPVKKARSKYWIKSTTNLENRVRNLETRVGDLEDSALEQWKAIIRLQYPDIKYLSIIYFRPGKTKLNNFDNKMSKELKKISDKGYSIFQIWGASDRTGTEEKNKNLALKRANYVANTINKLQPNTITANMVKGLGEILIAGSKKNSRVTIMLCK
ncbi:hypothetical protein DRQ26_05220 [bacterium]|nr:MAG: hypothetical protein DRQ26_05220 [bacterium]